MMSRPRISAVMSVYNGETYLAAAIDSVLSELGEGDEFIVVDDGSSDGTAGILARYAGRVRIITQDNRGMAAGINRAIADAAGEFIAFNDADDLWEPGRIASQMAAFEQDSALDAVFGMALQFVSPELSEELQRRYAPPVALMPGATLACVLVRMRLMQRLGPLDEAKRVTSVYSWFAQLKSESVRTRMIDAVVLRRRLHELNWSRTNRQELRADTLKSLRDHILRQRRTGPGGTGG
jgi:glycosyltransferase involved in cell wall biosynthesis